MCLRLDAQRHSPDYSSRERGGRPATVSSCTSTSAACSARQLAQSATVYVVEVERRFWGLPRLAEVKEVA